MKWTIQQYSMENPLVLAYEGKSLLQVQLDGKDDAIHSEAYRLLIQIVEELNKKEAVITLEKKRL